NPRKLGRDLESGWVSRPIVLLIERYFENIRALGRSSPHVAPCGELDACWRIAETGCWNIERIAPRGYFRFNEGRRLGGEIDGTVCDPPGEGHRLILPLAIGLVPLVVPLNLVQ